MLQSALDHYRDQQQIAARGLIAARRLRFAPTATLAAVIAGFQAAAAESAVAAVPIILAEQGLSVDQVAEVRPRTFAGWTNYGMPLIGLLPALRDDTLPPVRFDSVVLSQLQDTARQAAATQMAVTPTVTGYVRMLNPPSCSRCVILAGKFFRKNAGFQRHPRCDCRHIPTSENLAGDHLTDPVAYFDSISEAEQDRIFTKGAAELIRKAPTDQRQYVMGRTVNTRWTPRSTSAQDRRARLLPEEIIRRAGSDQSELLRLMKRYRYIR